MDRRDHEQPRPGGDGDVDGLSEVIASYLEALDAGEKPDPAEVIQLHPEFAGELQAFFQGDAELERLGRQLPPPAKRAPAAPPALFAGHEILREIARGGMGVVYEARQKSLGRRVALKMVLAGRLATHEELRRFQREAEAAARLDHPNIVPIYQVGEEAGQHYYSMKLVEGGSLSERRARFASDPRAAAQTVAAVARAAHYAHLHGIVHRDLKPANILLDEDGRPHIADFGLARPMDHGDTLTRTDDLVGTPSYMAPEMAAGARGKPLPAADIYSLGAILYDLLAGRPPFKEDSSLETLRAVVEREPPPPRTFHPGLPRDLETIVLKCLEKDPRRRYATAGDLAEDLERFLAGRPVEARRVSLLGRGWRWCRRKPAVATLAAAVAALLVVIAVGSLVAAFELRDKLRSAYLAQARAGRVSGRAGQRFESLEALAGAARIRPGLELRNEAIACMTLADLELARYLDVFPGRVKATGIGVDATLGRCAYGNEDGEVRIVELADGREVRRLAGAKPPARKILFSPDGRFLAALHWQVGTRWHLRLWDLDEAGAPLLVEQNGVLDFDAAQPLAVIGRADGSIAVYDLVARAERRRFRPGAGRTGDPPREKPPRPADESTPQAALRSCEEVRVAPGARSAAVYGPPDTRKVYLVDLDTGEILGELAHAQGVTSCAWDPRGVLLAVSSYPYEIHLWDAARREEMRVVRSQGEVTDLAFSPSGELLASTSWDTVLRLWDVKSGGQLVTASGTYGVHFGADGGSMASIAMSPEIPSKLWIWKLADGRELRRLHDPREKPPHRTKGVMISLEASRDGRFLAACGSDGVSLWRWSDGVKVVSLGTGEAWSARFEDDLGGLVTWGEDGLQRWPLEARTCADGSVTLHAGAARSLGFKSTLRAGLIGQAAFTPDGRWIGLVTDYNRGQGVLINLETMAAGEGAAGDADPAGTRIGNLRGLFNLALSPDGRWAAGGTWKGTGVSVWDVTSGRTIADLPVEGSARVAFSPDGRRLVTGAGIEYRSWDVPSWAPRWSLRRNNAGGLPGHLAFSPDGALLVVNDSLTDLKLLESDTGRELASLQAPTPQGVEWLTFSPSGSHLAVACADCTIELWDLDRIRAQLAAMGLGF